MRSQLGYAKLEDYGFWDRLRIFFVQKRVREVKGDVVYHYKIYRHRKVLIRKLEYREGY